MKFSRIQAPDITRKDILLEFHDPTDYDSVFRDIDAKNVQRIASFIKSSNFKAYFIGNIAINPNPVHYSQGKVESNSPAKSYELIHLAAVGYDESSLANVIDCLRDSQGNPTKESKKLLGKFFIGASPTPRKEIDGLYPPTYSFRFYWKAKNAQLSETFSKDIVLGIYDSFRQI